MNGIRGHDRIGSFYLHCFMYTLQVTIENILS